MNALDYAVIVSSPAFSFMLNDFFQKGMVFEFWGNFVNKEDYINKDINDKIAILKAELEKEISEDYRGEISDAILTLDSQYQKTPFWKKPLGNCIKCFHVWVFFGFTAAVNLLPIEVPIYLITLSISYLILLKINKWFAAM